jgi:hypothetical protein
MRLLDPPVLDQDAALGRQATHLGVEVRFRRS